MAHGLERRAYVRMLSAVFASMFLIRLAFGVTVVTFGAYLKHEDDLIYSLVVSASPLLELVGVVFAGVLIDRYGRKGILLTGLALGAVSLYGLALTKDPLLLGLVNAVHGVAAALILVTTLAIIATYAPPEHRGREMGLFNLSNIFGWIAGFVLGSLLLGMFEGRLEYTFVIAGLLATIGLLFANRMVKLPHADAPPSGTRRPDLRELASSVTNPTFLLLNVPWLIVFMLVGALITFFFRDAGALEVSSEATALAVTALGVLFVTSQLFWGRLADRYGRETIMLVGALGFVALMGLIVFALFTTPAVVETTALAEFDVLPADPATVRALQAVPAEAVPQSGTPVPKVVGVAPDSGGPGDEVRIIGEGLDNVTRVVFNGASANFSVHENGTLLLATVPPGATDGPLTLDSRTPDVVVFRNVIDHWFLMTLFLFVALAFGPAGLAAIADEAKEGTQGTAMSAYSLTLSLGFILGPPTVATIRQAFGGRGMVVYFAGLAVLLLAVVATRYAQTRLARRRAV